jgi:hypothetical protein
MEGFQSIGRVYKRRGRGGRKTSLILTDLLEPEYKVGITKITFANEELLEMGCEGDYVSIKDLGFFIDGKEFLLRTRDVQAIFNKS